MRSVTRSVVLVSRLDHPTNETTLNVKSPSLPFTQLFLKYLTVPETPFILPCYELFPRSTLQDSVLHHKLDSGLTGIGVLMDPLSEGSSFVFVSSAFRPSVRRVK